MAVISHHHYTMCKVSFPPPVHACSAAYFKGGRNEAVIDVAEHTRVPSELVFWYPFHRVRKLHLFVKTESRHEVREQRHPLCVVTSSTRCPPP